MSEAKQVQLDDERLARARRLRQDTADNLLALRDLVLNELGLEASGDGAVTITIHTGTAGTRAGDPRMDPKHDPNCITFQDEHGCSAYCDPPGICTPC